LTSKLIVNYFSSNDGKFCHKPTTALTPGVMAELQQTSCFVIELKQTSCFVMSWQICSKPVASCLISDREILPVELTSLCMQFGEQCLLRSIFLPFR
jgi:hypothetical protein